MLDSGILQGGWEYVWAAWGLTGVALVGYTISLLIRGRKG